MCTRYRTIGARLGLVGSLNLAAIPFDSPTADIPPGNRDNHDLPISFPAFHRVNTPDAPTSRLTSLALPTPPSRNPPFFLPPHPQKWHTRRIRPTRPSMTASRRELVPLTWINLHEFTAVERRQHAHQRGRSTPSTEPDFHEYGSEGPIAYDLEKMLSPEELARMRNMWDMWEGLPGFGGPASPEKLSAYSDYRKDPQWKRRHPYSDPDGPFYRGGLQSPREGSATRPTDDDSGEGDPGEDVHGEGRPRQDDDDDDQPATTTTPRDPGVGTPSDPGNPPVPETNNDQEPSFPGPPVLPSVLQHRPKIPRYHPPHQQPNQPSSSSPSSSAPRASPTFPASFPAYHLTQNMNEIAAYLANASYVASLCGPPLAELKYGIIVVPAGEEQLLFGPPPAFDPRRREFLDAVDDANRDYEQALRMHALDGESGEFGRRRFDDEFGDVEVEEVRGVEVGVAPGVEKGEGDKS